MCSVNSSSIYGGGRKIKGMLAKICNVCRERGCCYTISSRVLYILYGKDEFSLSQALESLKREKVAPDTIAANTAVFEAQQLSFSRLVETCSATPFLSPVRVVIVKGLLQIFEEARGRGRERRLSSKKADAALGEWEKLASYVEMMPSTTTLILVDSGDIRRDNRLLKLLSPLAEVKSFPPLNRHELSLWIHTRVQREGGTISDKAVNLLIKLVGYDLWVMSGEVDKLLSFAQGRQITEDDVRQVSSFAREISIFDLVDAILEGQGRQAQVMLWRLLHEGVSPVSIVAMLARQLRLIVLAKELEGAKSNDEINNWSENVSEYSLRKAREQAKRYSFERVRSAFEKLLEADVAMKSGKYDGDLALELLLAEL